MELGPSSGVAVLSAVFFVAGGWGFIRAIDHGPEWQYWTGRTVGAIGGAGVFLWVLAHCV